MAYLKNQSAKGILALMLSIFSWQVFAINGDFNAVIFRNGYFQLNMNTQFQTDRSVNDTMTQLTFNDDLIKASDIFVTGVSVNKGQMTSDQSNITINTNIVVGKKKYHIPSQANFNCSLGMSDGAYSGSRSCQMTNEKVMTGKFNSLQDLINCNSKGCSYKLWGVAKDIDYVIIGFDRYFVAASIIESAIARFWISNEMISKGTATNQMMNVGNNYRNTSYFTDGIDKFGVNIRKFFDVNEDCIRVNAKGDQKQITFTCAQRAPKPPSQ